MQLPYQLVCHWNNSAVLIADCSAAMAYDTARSFVTENFSSRNDEPRQRFTGALDAILAMAPGSLLAFDYSDETGKACAYITRRLDGFPRVAAISKTYTYWEVEPGVFNTDRTARGGYHDARALAELKGDGTPCFRP